ncbi:MAG: hypothetical protein KJ914_15580 [Gammaproteobacteria bacterium]|nr:hypothetical protein [Gammaproteobacteria bacterium]MBU1725006.1 hypothetical protein [Gammaproteobacteria bacterium]MBU2003900.1 hypothetical protein [Gammaproteobacteria bacterium]
MDNWIEHLNKPLVLVGFVLFVLAGLVKLFKSEKLSGKATERLMDKGMTLAFALGFLIVIFAFADSFMRVEAGNQPKITQHSEGKQSPNSVAGEAAQGAAVDQSSKGDQSPNTVGNADVKVGK